MSSLGEDQSATVHVWLDNIIKWLLPREDHFFDMLEQIAGLVHKSGQQFLQFCEVPDAESRLAIIEEIRDTEKEADRITAEVYESLNRTFVTPIDRGDIHHLASRLEEVTDGIFHTALQVVVHAMDELPAGSGEFGQLISRACEELERSVGVLREMKHPEVIHRCSKNVSAIGDRAGDLFRKHTAEMFQNPSDAIHLLKDKEFLEGMDRIVHSCKQVVHTLENVFIKNA